MQGSKAWLTGFVLGTMTCCALVTCTHDRTRAVLAAEAADPRLKAACQERIKVLKDLVEVATRSY